MAASRRRTPGLHRCVCVCPDCLAPPCSPCHCTSAFLAALDQPASNIQLLELGVTGCPRTACCLSRYVSRHPLKVLGCDKCTLQPQDAYGLEKLATEELCMHYDKDFGIECRIARFHNIYGPYGTWKGGREKAPAAFCRKVSHRPECCHSCTPAILTKSLRMAC